MKPLEGILVADFTHVLAGPFCTMLLADLGARVIKLERPTTGEDSRQFGPMVDGVSMYFESVNRGKESLSVNLKDSTDVELVRNIIQKADILIENFKPGTMTKLGLDYTDVKKMNPAIIYASISGFGQTGSMSHFPAYDELIQAMSGFMSVTGDPNGPPMKAGPAIADMLAGIYCFSAISTALYQREITKQGCQIDIAMFDCMIALLGTQVVAERVLHKAPMRVGNKHAQISPFGTFKCQDDELVICAATDQLFQKACDVMNLPDLKHDPQCQTNTDRLLHNDKITHLFEHALAKDTVARWHQKFVDAGVPAGPIHNMSQALEIPAVSERMMIVRAAPYELPGCPIKLSSHIDDGVRTRAPSVNEHGNDLRQEFSK